MKPVETQQIIWNKGFKELTIEDMCRNGEKFDLICNADRKTIHVCLKEEKTYENNNEIGLQHHDELFGKNK